MKVETNNVVNFQTELEALTDIRTWGNAVW